MHIFTTPVILGILEGITEFLPISSTGHLIIANQWLGLEGNFQNLFDVVIQLGAILSVIVYFRKKIFPISKENKEKQEIYNLWGKTIAGVTPALFFGVILADTIESKLFNPVTVASSLLIGGIVLLWLENRKKRSVINSLPELSYRDAVVIGLFQCLAMIPGTSRSAATIIGSMSLGASRTVATEFSFFLAS